MLMCSGISAERQVLPCFQQQHRRVGVFAQPRRKYRISRPGTPMMMESYSLNSTTFLSTLGAALARRQGEPTRKSQGCAMPAVSALSKPSGSVICGAWP
jgi:hypothetical protein